MTFAAATGMRPGEWVALEHRDIDRGARVAYVRRSFSKGRLRCTKTESSVRAVPLQAIAFAALDELPSCTAGALLFPAPHGGYLDLHNFRNRNWKPAQGRGRSRAIPEDLRSPSHLCNLRAPCRYLHVRALPLVQRRRAIRLKPAVISPQNLSPASQRGRGCQGNVVDFQQLSEVSSRG